MNILLLADPSNPHTIKWANALEENGFSVLVYGLYKFDRAQYNQKVLVQNLSVPYFIRKRTDGSILKLYYFNALGKIRKLIRSFRPDIIHSHYATSYGLLGALTNFHPFFLSVWGSGDIFDFPGKSKIHSKLYKFILERADEIFSTSSIMTKELKNYTNKKITQIAFGVDTEIFKPVSKSAKDEIVIGSIKALESTYGIDILLKAFTLAKHRIPDKKIRLKIVGGGSLKKELEKLASALNIRKDVDFVGQVPYSDIHKYHQEIDITIFPSRFESFGVAALEASACGKPIIVSDSGGLPEVVIKNVTGLIVPPEDIKALADAIVILVQNYKLRNEMGIKGREMVIDRFNWNDSVNKMIKAYRDHYESQGAASIRY